MLHKCDGNQEKYYEVISQSILCSNLWGTNINICLETHSYAEILKGQSTTSKWKCD